MKRLNSPIVVAVAGKLREAGWRYENISEIFGCHPDTVRTWVSSKYAEGRKRRQQRVREDMRRLMSEHPTPRAPSSAIERDAMSLVADIPPDTRDLTGRICGDPLPGRRALDVRPVGRPSWG